MLARVIEIATCLSVCLSVTRRYCVKTKNVVISSPSRSPKISKTVADTAKVTINDEYEVTYGLSIDTQIDDLG